MSIEIKFQIWKDGVQWGTTHKISDGFKDHQLKEIVESGVTSAVEKVLPVFIKDNNL